MIHKHCYHKIEGSERKIKGSSKCNKSSPYIHSWGFGSMHIKYTIKEECCLCGKIRTSCIFRDFDTRRGLEYKNEGE